MSDFNETLDSLETAHALIAASLTLDKDAMEMVLNTMPQTPEAMGHLVSSLIMTTNTLLQALSIALDGRKAPLELLQGVALGREMIRESYGA